MAKAQGPGSVYSDVIQNLFSCLKEIHILECALFNALNLRIEDSGNDDMQVGDLFSHVFQKEKLVDLYTEYKRKFIEKTLPAYEALSQTSAWREWNFSTFQKSKSKKPLLAILYLPITHIPVIHDLVKVQLFTRRIHFAFL